MKHLNSLLLFLGSAVGGVLLFSLLPVHDIQIMSTERAQHTALKAERQSDARAGRAGDNPNLDYYIIPRTWNSDRSISQGLNEAIAMQSFQKSMRKQALGATWTFVGPSNIAGRVRVVKYHPTNPDIMYAGSASGGLFKSTNGGSSWMAMTDHLPTLAIGHMAFDPVDPETIYIGTGEGSFNWDRVYGDGVYRSTDGGITWTNLMPELVRDIDLAINQVVVHPDDPSMIFAAATFGGGTGALFRSTDKGDSWQAVLNGPARDVIIDPYMKNRVIVGFGYYHGRSSNGLYYSDSLGKRFTFNKIVTNLPQPDSIGRIVIDASPSEPGLIICVMSRAPRFNPTANQDFLGIFRSSDHGESWEKLPSSTQTNMREFLRAQGDYNLHIRFHPTNPDYVFVGGIEWWRSANRGDSFSRITNRDGATNSSWVDMHYISFKPDNPNVMAMSSDGGVFISRNALAATFTCEEANAGLACMQFYAMDVDRSNTHRVAGGTQDRRNNLGMATDPDGWKRLSWSGDGGYVAFDYTDPNIFYITSQYGNLARTTNGGTSFIRSINGLTRTDASGNYMFGFVTPFIMHPTLPKTIFLGGNRMYRTSNGMQNWTPISEDLTGATHSLSQIQDLSLCKSDPNVIYMVTGSSARAYRTSNAMADPSSVSYSRIDEGLPRVYLGRVTVHPTNPDIAYVGTAAFSNVSGVYKTTDGGNTWTHMRGGSEETSLPLIPVGAIAIYEKNTDIVFAGTDIGVYISYDAGENWAPYGDGLPNVVVDDLKITPDDIMYAATHGRGMWMTSIVLDSKDVPKPLVIALGQNYPNPFNPSTVIPFTLSQAEHARVRLYDSRGRLVRTLLDERRDAGEHTLQFDAGNLQSGVYIYELETPSQRQNRKMMLLR
jgi:photosystem II stability/assembly factor-like uncharacterized protein